MTIFYLNHNDNNNKNSFRRRFIFRVLLIAMTVSFAIGQTFDPESLIKNEEFKKELQKINNQQKAENMFIQMAKEVLKLKSRVEFCEELWEGAFTKQIEVIMDVPVEKWNMAGWGYREIENVKMIVKANRKNALIHQLKDKGAHLATAMSLFSIAQDIYNAIEGENGEKLKAILNTYSFMQGWVMNKLGIGISNIATAGANIIGFSLNLFISDLFGRYEDYWWNAYLQYMEQKYDFNSWFELAKRQGEEGIKQRLYEFWQNADLNAATYYQPREHSVISRGSDAERLYKERFAAYYYSQFVYKPYLKAKFEREAALEAYEKERLARQKYEELMRFVSEIDLLQRAIEESEKLKKEEKAKPVSLTITPAQSTIQIDETVTFKVLAEDEAGQFEDVTNTVLRSPTFTGEKPGTFRVIANYEGLTATSVITVEKSEEEGETIDRALEEMQEEEEEDICSRAHMIGLISRLNELVSQAGIHNAQFKIYANKFDKEINNQAADPCTNGIVGYCYYNALGIVDKLQTILDGVERISTEIIMLLGICPDLAHQMRLEGFSVKSVVSSIAGLGGYKAQLQHMNNWLNERGCDENEVRQNGERINPSEVDPDFIQEGGIMVEVPGDSVDNDADGLQDESPETLAANNIILVLYDSGRAKDDVFSISVSNLGTLGVTPKGGRQSFGVTLPPGNYTATVQVISAPDNVGTFTLVVYENGVQIAALSGAPPEGSVAVLPFTVSGV